MYNKKINALILKEYEKENHQCYICEDDNYIYFTAYGYSAFKLHKKTTPFAVSSLSSVFPVRDLTPFFKLPEGAKQATITGIEKSIPAPKNKKEIVCQVISENVEMWIKKDYLKLIEGSYTKLYVINKFAPVLFETVTEEIDSVIMPVRVD